MCGMSPVGGRRAGGVEPDCDPHVGIRAMLPLIKKETRIMTPIQNSGMVAALTVSLMFSAAAAQAEMFKFTATLTGKAGVPATDSAATGTAEVTLDTEAKTVSWTYSHTGLSGAMTASHIHGPASATESAGPVIDTMPETMPEAVDGMQEMEGSAPITDEQAAELMDGMYYLNIHSEKYPDGEIRGQLVKME